jgi:hypothetical protein
MNEPVAVRYDFDGNGYLYMDAGSGSDWASRVKNCEFLYTHPMRNDEDDDIFRKEQVEKFYAEARPLSEKYKFRELTDRVINLSQEITQLKQDAKDCTCQGGHSEAYLKAKGKL